MWVGALDGYLTMVHYFSAAVCFLHFFELCSLKFLFLSVLRVCCVSCFLLFYSPFSTACLNLEIYSTHIRSSAFCQDMSDRQPHNQITTQGFREDNSDLMAMTLALAAIHVH